MPDARELPLYRCHKEVRALKISAIEFEADGSAKIAPLDDGYPPFLARAGFRSRFQGTEADLGYFVVYADGYQSWSPAKAFEDGYTLIEG